MKQSQWIFAALVLAGLVSVVTYAMNYLGGGRQEVVDPTIRPTRELVFATNVFPPPVLGPLEREEKTPGSVDYWFYNPHEEAVQVGVLRKNCSCASVDVFVLPEDRRPWLARAAVATLGTAPAGPLGSLSLLSIATAQIQKGVVGHELLAQKEKIPVPVGQVGWVRLSWEGRTGKQTLEATLWFDEPTTGKRGVLGLALYFQEPIRVRSKLRLANSLLESALEKGVRESIIVWSSTRDSLHIEASPGRTRDSAQSDPFIVGKAEPLSLAEIDELTKTNNTMDPSTTDDTRGSVRCAYRIPIVLWAVAPDGKTPFDIGPFHRRVHISSPDVKGEAKSVLVTGRVRGIIEIGNDEEGGGVNFRDFPRSRGKVESINLENRDRKVELAFDRQRSASFLDAEIEPVMPPPPGLVQAWTLRAKILPFKADGEFPRSQDPLYEDSAIYLKVTIPGKPPRSVRIPVTGRATRR